MKILNLNTHSIIEPDYDEKCRIFVDSVLKEKPDFITMQEVNQRISSSTVDNLPNQFLKIGKIPPKEDNHALKIWKMLCDSGVTYHFCWLGFKVSYDKFQEGLAIFSLHPIDEINSFYLTKTTDYNNWKTRMALLIKSENQTIVNTHTGWWDDTDEPLKDQLDILFKNLKNYENVILSGDFNSPDTEKEKGYSYIIKNGFFDTYKMAKNKDSGKTVKGIIDGWNTASDKRIDYVFLDNRKEVESSFTIFEKDTRVSDHLGIIVTL